MKMYMKTIVTKPKSLFLSWIFWVVTRCSVLGEYSAQNPSQKAPQAIISVTPHNKSILSSIDNQKMHSPPSRLASPKAQYAPQTINLPFGLLACCLPQRIPLSQRYLQTSLKKAPHPLPGYAPLPNRNAPIEYALHTCLTLIRSSIPLPDSLITNHEVTRSSLRAPHLQRKMSCRGAKE